MPRQSFFPSASLAFLADPWLAGVSLYIRKSTPTNTLQIEEITTQPVLVVKCGQTSCL